MRKWIIALLIFLFAVLFWYFACYKPSPPTARAGLDCPADSIYILSDDSVIRDIPLSSEIDEIPEYHDCQRFIGRRGREAPDYRQLVAIWAASRLDTLFGSGASTGEQEGDIVVKQDTSPQALRVPGVAVPVATILNFDATIYEPLHIEPGFNCLYLTQEQGPVIQWSARIVAIGKSPAGCQTVPSRGGHPLLVRTIPLEEGLTPDDIAPVARWDWDSTNYTQFIGIRCGESWCEVGGTAPPFQTSERRQYQPSWPVPPDNSAGINPAGAMRPNEKLRVLAVKGWYDEQLLATAEGTGQLRPTVIRGLAFPHPQLDRWTAVTAGAWVASAYVSLTEAYDGKLPLDSGLTQISLCQGSAGTCNIPPEDAPPCTAEHQDPADLWWAKLVSSSGTRYNCVRRRTHIGVIPAGAVRWRWSEVDEKLWIRCPAGCCQVN